MKIIAWLALKNIFKSFKMFRVIFIRGEIKSILNPLLTISKV